MNERPRRWILIADGAAGARVPGQIPTEAAVTTARPGLAAVLAARALRLGGIVVFPTETFYGLGVRAEDPDAVARLTLVKGRDTGKAMPVVVASLAQAESLASMPAALAPLAAAFWPGPLTLALPARLPLPPGVVADDATVGLRVSSHPVARELAARAGPLVATSANLAGAPPATRASEAGAAVLAACAVVVDDGPTAGGAASTVVGVRDGQVVVLREGAVTLAALARELGYTPAPAGRAPGPRPR